MDLHNQSSLFYHLFLLIIYQSHEHIGNCNSKLNINYCSAFDEDCGPNEYGQFVYLKVILLRNSEHMQHFNRDGLQSYKV